jgi:hypothetical protein
MIGGIDQILKQRAPGVAQDQPLMQKASVTPQLLDLIAAQKLITEKQQAAREAQMAMQQNPQTIAKQKDQELFALTKNEVARNVGGVAQQQEAQRQQNMARMANAGISGVQRPPVKMSAGGIVSFQDGGSAAEKLAAKWRAKGMSEEEIQRRLELYTRPERSETLGPALEEAKRRIGDYIGPTIDDMKSNIGAIKSNPLHGIPSAIRDMHPVGNMYDLWKKAGEYGPTLGDITESVVAGVTGKEAPDIPGLFERARPREDRLQEIAVQSKRLDPRVPTVTPASSPTPAGGGPAGPSKVETQGIMSPFAEGTMGGAYRDQYATDTAGTRAANEAQRAEQQAMKELFAAQTDPDKLRREQLVNALLGMGGRTSTASSLRGAGIASQLTRAQQEAQARKNAGDQYNMSEDIYANVSAQDKGQFGAGVAGHEAYLKGKNIEAKLEQARDVANTNNDMKAEAQLTRILGEIGRIKQTQPERWQQLQMDPDYIALQEQLEDTKDDWYLFRQEAKKNKIDEIKAAMGVIEQRYIGGDAEILQDLERQRDAIERRLGRGIDRSSPTNSGTVPAGYSVVGKKQ